VECKKKMARTMHLHLKYCKVRLLMYRREIVLTVCGTRVTPVPSILDITMDLAADTTDFLSGYTRYSQLAGVKGLCANFAAAYMLYTIFFYITCNFFLGVKMENWKTLNCI
jgi:hypothetical protein